MGVLGENMGIGNGLADMMGADGTSSSKLDDMLTNLVKGEDGQIDAAKVQGMMGEDGEPDLAKVLGSMMGKMAGGGRKKKKGSKVPRAPAESGEL